MTTPNTPVPSPARRNLLLGLIFVVAITIAIWQGIGYFRTGENSADAAARERAAELAAQAASTAPAEPEPPPPLPSPTPRHGPLTAPK